MEKTTSVIALREKIAALETTGKAQETALKEEFAKMYEQLKPANLLSQGVKSIASSPAFKQTVLSTALSVAAGYLSKKVLVGDTDTPFKKILGQLLQAGVTTGLIKNSDEIYNAITDIVNAFKTKKQEL